MFFQAPFLMTFAMGGIPHAGSRQSPLSGPSRLLFLVRSQLISSWKMWPGLDQLARLCSCYTCNTGVSRAVTVGQAFVFTARRPPPGVKRSPLRARRPSGPSWAQGRGQGEPGAAALLAASFPSGVSRGGQGEPQSEGVSAEHVPEARRHRARSPPPVSC